MSGIALLSRFSIGQPSTTVPAANTATAVGSNGSIITVLADVFSTVTDPAAINIRIETGSGTGVYTLFAGASAGAGVSHEIVIPITFIVPRGCRWKWDSAGTTGTATGNITQLARWDL